MKYLIYISAILAVFNVYGQKSICITIDDVPNPNAELLATIDSLDIPVTIFISENKLISNDSLDSSQINRLKKWIFYKNITLGNHTNGHLHYSKVGFQQFSESVIDGEEQTLKLLEGEQEGLRHFRFPYNDLGLDSLQQDSIKKFLSWQGYQIAPFTIESSDYIFNYVYSYYVQSNQIENAEAIGVAYVDYTIELLNFMDSLTFEQYGRNISHIYLCHDNQLNTDYLPMLITAFNHLGYKIDAYEHILADEIYSSTNFYHKKYGISWVYRWTFDSKERNRLMRSEPIFPDQIEKEYERIKLLTTAKPR